MPSACSLLPPCLSSSTTSSLIPHIGTDTNTTAHWRRAAYLTFNRASDGDHHERYYQEKKALVVAEGSGGPISINDDFAGTIVP